MRTTRRRWTTVTKVAVAFAAGFVVLALLFPASVLHSNPPQCSPGVVGVWRDVA
jgi:hypothetical protein